MPDDWITTIGMAAVAALGAAAFVANVGRLRSAKPTTGGVDRVMFIAIALVAGALMIYRAVAVHDTWEPLGSHVDGLVLLTAIVSVVVVYLQQVRRLRGVALFASPVVAVMGLWGVCASWWSFAEFDAHGAWAVGHRLVAYLAAATVALSAVTGGMYLYVRRQLRSRTDPAKQVRVLGKLANLEAVNRWMTRASAAAFVLLSITLVLGAVDAASGGTSLGEYWLANPKVIGSLAIWVLFGIAAHTHLVPTLRGARAAVMTLLGLALLLAVLAMSVATPGCRAADGTVHVTSDGPSDANVGVNVELGESSDPAIEPNRVPGRD